MFALDISPREAPKKIIHSQKRNISAHMVFAG
jgi:hypothetical protein